LNLLNLNKIKNEQPIELIAVKSAEIIQKEAVLAAKKQQGHHRRQRPITNNEWQGTKEARQTGPAA